ncbi:WD40-repeat-containing domain protein [Chytriomyces cf. hyalinus JEL632]|nr:WD40-repeat-containing domain protein [Chytriomyces cf. hyalinus JEL632]
MDEESDTGQCLETLRFHEGTVYSIDVFFADDYNIASAGFERAKTGASSKRVAPEDSRNSRPITLLSGSHDQTISIATVRKISQPYGLSIQASRTHTLKGHTSDVYALEVLPEACTTGSTSKLGHFISAGDYTVQTWDLETQLPNSILSGHTGYVSCIKVRGKRAFSGSWDTTIRSWNLETGKPMHVFKGQHANIVNCIDVTTSDLFSGSWDQTIVQWSRATGDAVQSFRGHTDGVQCLQVYNECLVSGSMDKTLRIWSISTGKTVRVIKGHTGGIECLHVVDDVCFTGSYDKTMRCFDLETGECLLVYQGHTDGIYCLKYFDGLLFSGSGDKSIRVWDASFLQKQVPAVGMKGPLCCCISDSTR